MTIFKTLISRKTAYIATLLCMAAIFLLTAGCSSASKKDANGEQLSKAERKAQRLQKDIKKTENQLYNAAQRALKQKQWKNATESLLALEENFPFGAFAEQAQLELIYTYHQDGEYESAIASADRFIRLHPQHRNIDYAYYMRGASSFYQNSAIDSFLVMDLSQKDLGSARESIDYFAQLIHKFPESPYALDAQKRMIFLRNLSARHEIQVANYYFKRGAYIAAANRGKYVVENFQGTPAVADGLAVMIHAYHLLGYKELSESTVQVLNNNFSNYPALIPINKSNSNKNDIENNAQKPTAKFNLNYAVQRTKTLASTLTLGLLKRNTNIKYDTRKLYNPQNNTKFSGVRLP